MLPPVSVFANILSTPKPVHFQYFLNTCGNFAASTIDDYPAPITSSTPPSFFLDACAELFDLPPKYSARSNTSLSSLSTTTTSRQLVLAYWRSFQVQRLLLEGHRPSVRWFVQFTVLRKIGYASCFREDECYMMKPIFFLCWQVN